MHLITSTSHLLIDEIWAVCSLLFVIIFITILSLNWMINSSDKLEIYRARSGSTVKSAITSKASGVKYHGTTRALHLPSDLSIYKTFDSKDITADLLKNTAPLQRYYHTVLVYSVLFCLRWQRL